jgi:hypothetical protein
MFLKTSALGLLTAEAGLGRVAHAAFDTRRSAEGIATDSKLHALSLATDWINSAPLRAQDLAGKVVLINFLTYTCINWLRQLPYVRAWAEKYKDRGLVVIGVHSPEFSFEKNIDNVRRAMMDLKVGYPVAVDSEHSIWRAFRNNYWPALYFSDGAGRIRDRHFGEGEYDTSERRLQKLLSGAGAAGVGSDLVAVDPRGVEAQADWRSLRSPENYTGHARTQNFASPGGAARDRPRTYAEPRQLRLNQWATVGDWTLKTEAAVLNQPNGRIVCRFHARDLHLVMGPAAKGRPARFRVLVDGKPPGGARGLDVDEQGSGTAAEQRMYQLIRQTAPIAERRFDIEFLDPGVEAYAFTFG